MYKLLGKRAFDRLSEIPYDFHKHPVRPVICTGIQTCGLNIGHYQNNTFNTV